jgi:hypothetical protein
LTRRASAEQNVIHWLFRAVCDARHITQINRALIENTYHHAPDLCGGAQKAARLDQKLTIARRDTARRQLAVGLLKDGNNHRGSDVVSRHSRFIERDEHLPPLAANDLYFRNIRE